MRYFFIVLALICQLCNLICLFLLPKEGVKTKPGRIIAIISIVSQAVALLALFFICLNK